MPFLAVPKTQSRRLECSSSGYKASIFTLAVQEASIDPSLAARPCDQYVVKERILSLPKLFTYSFGFRVKACAGTDARAATVLFSLPFYRQRQWFGLQRHCRT